MKIECTWCEYGRDLEACLAADRGCKYTQYTKYLEGRLSLSDAIIKVLANELRLDAPFLSAGGKPDDVIAWARMKANKERQIHGNGCFCSECGGVE